ncbi:putative centromere protein L [Scophthalmus maximus]|uniref:Centromere protein L n=1 Tax=Scophthalmus maximus TaxID=52904 RepID=A0A2U9AVU7_SCOMX|nr:centromere protein L [Scophthalmus maximus]AWO95730.1 putative centromere protein L [Scophthalmus maximus]
MGKRDVQICFRFPSGTLEMEPPPNGVVRTPLNSVVVQRRSKSKSYRLSYRSCLGAASRLGFTPALTARRLNTSRRAPRSRNISEKVNSEQLALLLKTEWRLSYVTPLFKFRHTQLKSYSRQLSAFIAAEKQQGLAVDVEGSQSGFRVSFSVVQGMTETDDDAETVLIQIHTNPLFARQDEPQRSVWSGLLTCINGNTDYLHSLPKDFICLPLFGCSGSEVLTTLVKSWFQQAFDCSFGPLEISHTSLQWLVALWTNCHSESGIQQLKMIWTLPVVPPLQITYTVNPQDAWELWSSVRRDPQEENEGGEAGTSIDIKEVMRFVQGLKGHFYRHFRLDLSSGSLKQVSTALGSAKYNGRIKISNSRYMITTLTLLTECALLKMPI